MRYFFNIRFAQLKQAFLVVIIVFLSIASECTNTGTSNAGSKNLPFSIFVYENENPNKAVREAKHFIDRGYPCEVFRSQQHTYVTAVGGYATKEEADSILSAMPDTLFALESKQYVGKNTGFLGKIFSESQPIEEGKVTLGDYCIPVYNTSYFSDATEFAERLFSKGHYSEVYETAPNDFTVTIGAYTTMEKATSELKRALGDGSAPRGSEIGSREAFGKRVYPL